MKKYNYNFSGDSGVFQSWFKGEGAVLLPEKGRVWKTDDADNIIFLNKNGVVQPEDCPYVLEYTTTDGQPIDKTWESDVISTFNESGKVQFARPCDNVQIQQSNTLKTLILPTGLTKINSGDFAECYNLTSVIIPNSVSYIVQPGFINCTSLQDISYLGSVDECRQALEDGLYTVPALYIQCLDGQFPLILEYLYTTADGNPIYPNMDYKTSDYIDNQGVLQTPLNQLTLNSFAFEGQTTLQSIILPDDLEVINQGAFSGCSSLESITLGAKLKEINSEAFNECVSLTEITIPENVQVISENAFYRCSNLTSVVWNAENFASVSYPHGAPFYNIRSQITSFTFGDRIQHIPEFLCYTLNNLTSITIPNSVTSIGTYAFKYCSGLTSITCEATTPPVLDQGNDLPNVTAVYVPSQSVEAYKNATNWSYYSDVIQAIP